MCSSDLKCCLYLDKKTDHNARVVQVIQEENALDYVFVYIGNLAHAREIRLLEPRLAIMLKLNVGDDIPALMNEIHPEMVEVGLDMLDDTTFATLKSFPVRISVDAMGVEEVGGLGWYQFLFDRGLNIIQTDNVSTLAWFLRTKDGRRTFPSAAAAQAFEKELAAYEHLTGIPLSPWRVGNNSIISQNVFVSQGF